MPITYRSLLTMKYKDLINEKFNFLMDFFNFEPGNIFIEILPLEEFDEYCKIENIKISRTLSIISNPECYKSKAFEFFYTELVKLKSNIED